jgi:hypothetical protein
LLVFAIVLTFPIVQTKLARYFTEKINADFGTNISVDEIAISVFGGVKLKKVLILDHHKDTLIFANYIKTNIKDGKKMLDGDLIFDQIKLEGLLFNLKTYKKEKQTNIDYFIDAFGTSTKPSQKHFLLMANKVYLSNGHFILTDENRSDPKDVDFTKLSASLTNFKIYGPEVTTAIDKMSFKDHRGVFVTNINADFAYTKKCIKINNLDLETKNSNLKGDVVLNYVIEDFSDFTNKVRFNVAIQSASLGSNDIRCFYKELGRNQHFYVKTKIKGTLNDLRLTNLRLFDSQKSKITGAIHFKNLFPKKNQKFYMNGKFKELSSSYKNLVVLLPNVLGKKLPDFLSRLGTFSLVGDTQLTSNALDAEFTMLTQLGKMHSNIKMNNFDSTEKANYAGNVVLEEFDLGTLFGEKTLRKVSLDIDVVGQGFLEKYLNMNIKGAISKIDFNNYNYSNVAVNGVFNKAIYEGEVLINDPNLNMDFDGIVDLRQRESQYDFHIKVDNADFHRLKLIKDPISQFKGDITVQVFGNSLENLQGNVHILQTSYKNSKDTYVFEDFTINSNFDSNKVRTINLHSPDIADGEIVGKFEFKQLKNLIANSLGSLYANFKPSRVKKGQFLKFDFTIYNKIVELLYPEIAIGSNANIKGNLNSDNNEFKLNFNSPQIIASDNTFDNIRIAIDNKNPLYNTFVELDSIKTKYYKIRDFSLLNVTANDTLYVRSEFKGGSKGDDSFNLNLYHTINKDNNNVVGISKSEIKLKEYLWFLNEEADSNNQIVFDKGLKNFTIDDIIFSHEGQKIELAGEIKGNSYKDLKLKFKEVDIYKITPANEKFVFNGDLNGEINLKQNNAIYQPTASLKVDNLNLNNTKLGTLDFAIEGDESFRKFAINSSLENDNLESLKLNGNLAIVNKETLLDLNLTLDQFDLGILSPMGGEVLSNIRGVVSGNASIEGNVKKPDINGRLYVDKAGMTIPYLNVDYELSEHTLVDLTNEKFLFRYNTLKDTKYNTKGFLNGSIEHKNFGDWKLDLALNSKKLLALDTKDSEDAAYFGTAFINGEATIKGAVNALLIKVNAKSEKGTTIKIPINNAESVSDNTFIHFLTLKEKYNQKNGIVDNSKKYNGLELDFEFDITPNAEVEVILDRNSGHGMKGKGNGTLLFKINTLGKFNMWGDFIPFEGTYNFKYGGLVDKKFNVKKGGSIIWEGNPLKAQLNLEAVYKTSANPAILLENSSFNTKVPVEVVVGIRGDLTSPEPDFNIVFPTVSNVLKSEIQYKLNDKEARQTQALYLLSTGSFLSPEGVGQSDILKGSLFETASSMLDGILGSENDKFNVGINLVSADNTLGKETDGRFEATISSKLNERITINGKVGVPFGGLNESAIVGNVEMLYRVNDDGTLNLRLFNKENDITYIGEGIGYTQGVGVSYELDFDSFKEFVNRIFKKYKLVRVSKSQEHFEDSIFLPNGIDFTKKEKKHKEKPKRNQDAIIPEED